MTVARETVDCFEENITQNWFDFPEFHGATTLSEPGPPFYRGFTVKLRQTTLRKTPLDELSARHRDPYLTTHNTHKRQTSMPRWDSDPDFQQASGRAPHTLDRAALGLAFSDNEC